MIKLEEIDTDHNERPLYPHKIVKAKVGTKNGVEIFYLDHGDPRFTLPAIYLSQSIQASIKIYVLIC